jgi:hypothetical protein
LQPVIARTITVQHSNPINTPFFTNVIIYLQQDYYPAKMPYENTSQVPPDAKTAPEKTEKDRADISLKNS